MSADGLGGSASRNTEALSNQNAGGSGEFHSKRERDEPLTTHGHKPGVLVGNDEKEEFSAKTLPAGSAPADRTFQPNPTDTAPPTQQYRDNNENDAPQASANDFPGATSGDVHTGLGHPGQGQSSSELRHDGGKSGGTGGLDGLASGAKNTSVDPHLPEHANQRAEDKEEAVIGRGNIGGPAAEERLPESA